MEGSIELTAYVLSVTAANGFAIPEASKEKMVKALQAVVEGRLTRKGYGPWDIRPVRIAALAALARNKASRDRKSVVWGKRVSERVDLGGRRINKKKKKEKKSKR